MTQINTTVLDKFHEDTGQIDDLKTMYSLYYKLMKEEEKEFFEAENCSLDQLKEALDVIVVTYGCAKAIAALHDVDLKPFWDELDRELKSKYQLDGTFLRREDGKILKPSTFKKADFYKVWEDNAGA